jgi:hypothetical protein
MACAPPYTETLNPGLKYIYLYLHQVTHACLQTTFKIAVLFSPNPAQAIDIQAVCRALQPDGFDRPPGYYHALQENQPE